jgi:DNA polymerase I-like protein with 3'-5' exonuclease and polymerase domains
MFTDMLEGLRRPKIEPKEWMSDCELILGTTDNLEGCIEECINSDFYGLDVETTGLDQRVFDGVTKDKIVGICLAPSKDKGYYFPLTHSEGSSHNISWRLMGGALKRLFDVSVKAQPVLQNAGFDMEFLEFNGYVDALGAERWNTPRLWHDTKILKYLLNPREKGGRGLKQMSKGILKREMIELEDLIPKSNVKDYSKLDPSWSACVLYAAADAMNTVGIFEILNKEYTEAVHHSSFIYTLEKKVLVATRWMMRNRVYVDRKRALTFCQEGQKLWFNSLLEVYGGANDILGRDITPNYLRILKGEIKGVNLFDPMEVEGMSYKTRVDEARKEALRNYPDSQVKIRKEVPRLSSDPRRKAEGLEDIEFPSVYDILSPQQLGLLFREMSVPGLTVTEKSGQVATARDILESVVENASKDFPFMGKIKSFRNLAKALGQYLIPFVEDVGIDGTLKPKFDQMSADTGRFSCKTNKQPWKVRDGGCRVPFQGIPATYDKSKPDCIRLMRDCITVRDKDFWLAAVDYAGVELRLVTNLSREPKWVNAFYSCSDCGKAYDMTEGEDGFPLPPPSICTCGSDKIGDLHTGTAVAFYGDSAKQREDWKVLRGNGKACNFALCYGGTGKAVQRSIGCGAKEGDEKYRVFTKTYSGLIRWWKRQHEFARAHGYVKTAMGRIQPLPDIKSDEYRFKSKDERKALNGPIQGTSADVTKLAMALIYDKVLEMGWQKKLLMILTVHDEIVFEIHKDILKEAIEVISNLMTKNTVIQKMNWPIPLLVDVELGKTWTVPYDLKDIEQGEGDDELVKIFGGQKPIEVEKPKEEVADLPPIEVFQVSALDPETVERLAQWIKSRRVLREEWDVQHEGRSIKALLV